MIWPLIYAIVEVLMPIVFFKLIFYSTFHIFPFVLWELYGFCFLFLLSLHNYARAVVKLVTFELQHVTSTHTHIHTPAIATTSLFQ